MVQILPRFDPGGEIGKALGSGMGQALSTQADRQRMLGALENLKDLDKPIEYQDEQGQTMTRAPTFGEKMKSLVGAGAGIPGWMNVVEKVGPLLMQEGKATAAQKGIERKKPERASDVFVEEEEGTVSPLTDKVSRLSEMAGEYVQSRSSVPESLTSEVPRFGRAAPVYETPSNEELVQRIQDYKEAGRTEEDAFNQVQREIQLDLQKYDSQKQGWERDLRQFAADRGLESEQRTFVDQNAQDFLRQQGFSDEKGGVPQYYTDTAYRMFQDKKSRNPKGTDQQIWSQARQKLGQMIEHEAIGSQKGRPWLGGIGKKNAVNQTKAWAEDYLKMAGNTPESRAKAQTILMNGGWSRHMAKEITQPFSPSLEKTFNKLPKIAAERPGPQGQVPMGTVNANKQKMKQIEAMVPQLAKSVSGQDSIYLLRNKLVRDKGMNKIQADEIIEQVRKVQGFLPHQSNEIQLLQESPQKDMWRIFYEAFSE